MEYFDTPEESITRHLRQKRLARLAEQASEAELEQLKRSVSELQRELAITHQEYSRTLRELKGMFEEFQTSVRRDILFESDSVMSRLSNSSLPMRIFSMEQNALCSVFERKFAPELNEELVARWAKHAMTTHKNNPKALTFLGGLLEHLGNSEYSRLSDSVIARQISKGLENEEVTLFIHFAGHGTGKSLFPPKMISRVGYLLARIRMVPFTDWSALGFEEDALDSEADSNPISRHYQRRAFER